MIVPPERDALHRRALEEAHAAIDNLVKWADKPTCLDRHHIHAIEQLRLRAASIKTTFGDPELVKFPHIRAWACNEMSMAIDEAMKVLIVAPLPEPDGPNVWLAIARVCRWMQNAAKEAA